jgi:hypothetical protein
MDGENVERTEMERNMGERAEENKDMKKERKGRTGLRKGDTKDIIHS